MREVKSHVLWQGVRHQRRRLSQSWLYKYIYNIIKERQSLTEWGEREPISVFETTHNRQQPMTHDHQSLSNLLTHVHTQNLSQEISGTSRNWTWEDGRYVICDYYCSWYLSLYHRSQTNILSRCSLGDKSINRSLSKRKKKSSSNQIPLKIK